MPIRPNIFKFVADLDPDLVSCPLCNGPPESLQHIFLSCPLSRILWQNSRWPLNTTTFAHLPFASWIKAVLHPHSVLGIPIADVQKFQISTLVLMDFVWLARNKLLFYGAQPEPIGLLKRFKSVSAHHMEAWFIRSPVFSIWKPPPPGFLKANFDVAIWPNFAVATTTLRDSLGNFLAVYSLRLPAIDANKGEALAALLAVWLTHSFGCSSLILEGDSLLTILAVNEPCFCADWNTESIFFFGY